MSNNEMPTLLSRHDLAYERPPACWQDGFLLGNGSLGAVFFALEALEWLVNKTDVIDGRVRGVKRVIPRAEADRMVKAGAKAHDFEREERSEPGPEGMGPKTCCHLRMDLGMSAGSGTRSALPSIVSRLALHDATLRVAMDKHLCHPRVESFVHAEQDLLVIRVRDISPIVSWSTRLFFSRPEDIELPAPELWEESSRLFMRMTMPEAGAYVAGLAVVPRAGMAYRDTTMKQIRAKYHPPALGGVRAAVRGRFGVLTVGGDFDLYLAVTSDRDAADPAAEVRRRLDAAVAADAAALDESHRRWWRDFWNRSRVELGDPELEALFYRSLYALGCSYRKAPVAGLLGLCHGPGVGPMQISPWAGDLHHDLNVQCPFFPVHALNHSDLFDAYLDTYHAFLPEARRLAREVWSAPGAHFDMCFNARGRSIMGGVGTYRYFFGGSYVALMHCLCWRYTRDRQRLEARIYPFLKEILAFYQHMLSKGDDDRYHLHPAHACELDVMDTGDPVQVISMLKICLETAVEAASLLGADPDLAAVWREMLEHMPEYPVGRDAGGREIVLDGTGIPPDHHVGQAGCLHPVYPCGEVAGRTDPALPGIYNRTLDSVVEKTAQKSYANAQGFHYQCVWQCFFRAMTALRLGRAAEFWDHYLPMFLKAYVKPNGLVSHDACVVADPAASEANLGNIPAGMLRDVGEPMPTFEPWCGHGGGTTPNPDAKRLAVPLIEASGDFLTMITECLLQSHDGVIRVFPGWRLPLDAGFENLMAEGNIMVSAEMRRGRVEFLQLRRGENCTLPEVRVLLPWNGMIRTCKFAVSRQVDGACIIIRPEDVVT